ncbi:unnamed protein product [Rhizophagus irregularis]|nr:unnamed protein product [Rhizophagus irregularis]
MSFPLTVTPVFSTPASLIITSTSNLTPNEKRDLLFDVDRTLENPMKVFNVEWWPLVSNIWTKWNSYEYTRPPDICSAMIKVLWIASSEVVQVERYKNSPNHIYSLSEVDKLKWPKVIKSLVEIEAAKNYPPSAITSAVKEYIMLELDLDECTRELKHKEVTNIKYKIHGPTKTRFIGNLNLKSDILESVSFLTEQGCWNVGAHYFVSNEDANTVAEALTIICNKYCHWSFRYILADHSNIEAKSIKKTFSGIDAGEQKC